MGNSKAILPLPYFGNIYFYAILFQKDHVIDVHEHYRKQTFRNRSEIISNQGILKLTIPIVKNSGQKTACKDVKIDLKDSWHKIHPRTLKAAYGSAPFYEFYIDDLKEIWETPSESLMENNLRCHEIICKIMEWDLPLNISAEYEESQKTNLGKALTSDDITDLTSTYSPGLDFNFGSYHQVFQTNKNFVANLSILDLIFNLGPQSEMYLNKGI